MNIKQVLLIIALLPTLAATFPPYPPGYIPKQPLLPPKMAELKASLGTPMARNLLVPVVPSVPIQGFVITNITVSSNQVSLSWMNGVPPFQIEGEPSLSGPWNLEMPPTTARSRSFPQDFNHFFRVIGNIVMPLTITHTNPTTLTWSAPDIMPGDALQAFTLKRSTDNGATFPNTVAVVQPGQPYSVDDTTAIPPGGSLTWELLEQTLNGVVVPYSKPSASNVAGGSIVWAGTSGQVGSTVLLATVFDSSGNIWATGSSSSFTPALELYKFRPNGSLELPTMTYPDNGGGQAIAQAIAADTQGNVWITGFFCRQLDLGNGHILTGTSDITLPNIFVAKISTSGVCLVAKKFGSNVSGTLANPTCSGYGIAVSPDGSVVITGRYYGPADFGNGWILAGNSKSFVAKIDGDTGDTVWAFTLGADGNCIARSITVDTNNNIFVTGGVFANNFPINTVDFKGVSGPSSSVSISDNWDIFLAKYNSSGALSTKANLSPWVNIIHTDGYQYPPQSGFAVASDKAGFIVVSGGFHGTINAGGGSISPSNVFAAFVIKYNPNGDYVWGYYPDTGQATYGKTYPGACSMALDPSGNVLITGSYYTSPLILDRTPISPGIHSITKNGLLSCYVAKFGSDGTFMWAWSGDNTDSAAGISIACNTVGRIALLGGFTTSTTNPARPTPMLMWNPAPRFSGGSPYPDPQVGNTLTGYYLAGSLNSDIFLYLLTP